MQKKYNKICRFIIILILTAGSSNLSFGIINITHNQTWSTHRTINEPVIIYPQNTLTISSHIRFSFHAYIVVMPGGKLMVDGGTLTSMGFLWEGIKVFGNRTLPQEPQNQGMVVLGNNAEIRNARCGITLGTFCREKTTEGISVSIIDGGGIVRANNAKFINNKRAVHFNEYVYRNPYTANYDEVDNVSYFRNCSFIIEPQSFFGLEDVQVFLCGVRGVDFNGCTFNNQKNNHNGIGIYSNASGVKINISISLNLYPINIHVQQTTFSGFNEAVHVISAGTKPTMLLNSIMSTNNNGLNLYQTQNARLESNTVSSGMTGIGFVVEASTHFKLENNQFNETNIGIRFNAHGTVDGNHFCQYNTFNFENIANEVNGLFGNNRGDLLLAQGLRFNCNKYQSNISDDIKITSQSTICQHQTQACNYFMSPTAININNDISNPILYYYYDSTDPYQKPNNVINTSLIDNADCYCNAVGSRPLLVFYNQPAIYIDDLENEYNAKKTEFNSLLLDYMQQYNDTIHWAEYYDGDIYYQEQVEDYFELSDLKIDIDWICLHAIQILLSDTVLDKSAFKNWVSRTETPQMSFLLAECYLDEDNKTAMDSILIDMFAKYPYYDRAEILKYKACLDYLADWNLDNVDTVYISQSAIDSLRDIASGTGSSAFLALSILERIGEEQAGELLRKSNELNNATAGIPLQGIDKEFVQIVPNPIEDVMKLKTEDKNTVIQKITFYDVYGKQLFSKQINTTDIDINLSNYSRGVYFISCQLNNGRTIIKKIIKN